MTSWFERLLPSVGALAKKKADVPEGIWLKCKSCSAMLYRPELARALYVCPKCDGHLRLNARQRLDYFFDDGTMERFAEEKEPIDRLKFKDLKKYRDRLIQAKKMTNETEALIVGQGQVNGIPFVAGAFEFQFMGGSMGAGVGERFVAAVHRSITLNAPFVCFAASGGARMQEGLFSLMQMAKTSAALNLLKKRGIPFISVLTDPVYGGVSASFAMLGDVIIGEPGAMIGFAGPRVIEQTVRQQLPEGFQKSEFLLQTGAIDMIVHRAELKEKISTIIRLLDGSNLLVVPSIAKQSQNEAEPVANQIKTQVQGQEQSQVYTHIPEGSLDELSPDHNHKLVESFNSDELKIISDIPTNNKHQNVLIKEPDTHLSVKSVDDIVQEVPINEESKAQ